MRSAASTACAPSRCRRWTSGSSSTATCGRHAWTPSSATSRRCPTHRRSQGGAHVYGELERAGDRWLLRFVRRLPHPPEKVWRALTEPEHVAAWFPADIEGERRSGAPL